MDFFFLENHQVVKYLGKVQGSERAGALAALCGPVPGCETVSLVSVLHTPNQGGFVWGDRKG